MQKLLEKNIISLALRYFINVCFGDLYIENAFTEITGIGHKAIINHNRIVIRFFTIQP